MIISFEINLVLIDDSGKIAKIKILLSSNNLTLPKLSRKMLKICPIPIIVVANMSKFWL